MGQSGEEAADEQGEEEDEEDEDEEKASETLLHELWKDCREEEREIRDKSKLISATGNMVRNLYCFKN